ncbi:protein-beta-aspartate methyltransferase [Cordyceps militaris CM01]|uniref:protein-L-isoaspartate(D-aspartate) O-methyltransferase n=1 Tax=Cordyceps militaris (strain CM01) TaxID=983644 RepID=G3JNF5_CORMM|nr:protein-beta-aspartate methyltransferase [Cordyceps militaris CM01]EGX89974.1 protein-beta-aspartate methyltransferase [Cordyceps militaris CM01]
MAWRCSGSTNKELIENMWKHKLISDSSTQVDRRHYAPSQPYQDSPQYIGYQATISAPHMHAIALEHLISFMMPSDASPAPRALDIGSGSGYLTHVMAELVGPRGLVVGVEHINALRDKGEANMRKSAEGTQLLNSGKVKFIAADGRKGLNEPARKGEEELGTLWDAIHVGASASEVHDELINQLKSPGCMFIPVEDSHDRDSHQNALVKYCPVFGFYHTSLPYLLRGCRPCLRAIQAPPTQLLR